MAGLSTFRSQFGGPIYTPGDSGYDDVRPTWNADATGRPAVIARCLSVGDVRAALAHAREHEYVIAVRSGRHSYPGHSTCDGGIVIDLSLMQEVRVDPARRTAEAQAGVLWAGFDTATQNHGLASTGGTVGHTGIAGLTLGGGVGYLARRCGLTCDNLVSAEVVTASGDVVLASQEENPDLFWGLRGGGGNFGIVTKFTYRLHELKNQVLHAWFLYPRDAIEEMVLFFDAWAGAAPRELGANFHFDMLPGANTLPEGFEDKPAVGIRTTWTGPDHEAGRAYFDLVRRHRKPLAEKVVALDYGELQTILDKPNRHGLHYYVKSGNVRAISPQLAAEMKTIVHGSPPRVHMHFLRLGGAISDIPEAATAYSDRGAKFMFDLALSWEDPAVGASRKQWARDAYAIASPHLSGGVYVNFLSGEEEIDRIAIAHGPAKYARLVALKERYDPGNLFRLNPNIRPRQRAAP